MALFHPQIWRQQLKDALIYWVYLPILVLGPGKIIDLLWKLPSDSHWLAGGIALAAGGGIVWRATIDLGGHGGGTPSPFRPAKNLVTAGAYRCCRHPMWLGYDIMALGVILFIGSIGALGFSYPVFLVGQLFFLRKEEKILLARFKQGYRDYQRTTGMLLPSLRTLLHQGKKS